MPKKLEPVMGFVGMSHLGLISATAAAEKGFSVIAYDANSTWVEAINNGLLPIEEPGLKDMLMRNRGRQIFTSQLENLCVCDVIYIAADVPTSEHNVSDLAPIRERIEKLASILNESMTVVILSQVSPGFTRGLDIPLHQLYYQVETLIFGQAVHRALYPERFILGCADPKAPLPTAYETLLKAFDCPILPMRYESAELAKISINLFLVASVSTANTLSNVAASVGADWNEIIPTLKLDKRIGPHAYLQPGLGISGGNLERDLQTVIQLGDQFGTNVQLVKTYCEQSQYQKNWVYRCLQDNIFPHCANPHIAILGLAYKINTDSVKNSPSLFLLKKLQSNTVRMHDPVVSYVDATDLETAVSDADVLIVMTPWDHYKSITASWLREKMRGDYIIDPFQVFDQDALCGLGFHVFTLGKMIKEKELAYA